MSRQQGRLLRLPPIEGSESDPASKGHQEFDTGPRLILVRGGPTFDPLLAKRDHPLKQTMDVGAGE